MAIEVLDIGNNVICDQCGEDYTTRDDKGGILFGSKALCPECTSRMMKDIEEFNEHSYIKARCPDGVTFREWVLSLRGGNNTVTFYTGQDALDSM
jgi:hypothetical protein